MRDNMRNQENDFEEDEYFVDKRARRTKRRRHTKIYTAVGLMGCLAVLAAVMYAVVWMWGHSKQDEVEPVLAESIQKIYTQQEVDGLLAEIKAQESEDVLQAADAREDEILGGIQKSLEEGNSLLKTLRPLYPDKLMLASGGVYHFVPIRDDIRHHTYEETNLNMLESGEVQYLQDGQVISHKGIDVSKFQGKIDWQKVAGDGVEFAFIRVGYRGYGAEGKLVEDEYFEPNIKGAIAAGIKVGVYFYSQAVNETELQEEVDFVLERIAPYKIECPVVYDVEKVADESGRMNRITVEERTKMTLLFCQAIEQAGYRPMFYHNMEMATLMLNLEQLQNYDRWFAYYNNDFYYPYDYSIWQYSEKGKVDGIKGDVDLNISFKPLWEE